MSKSQIMNQIVVAKNIMISMRDGVGLAADVYRPAQNGEGLPGKVPTVQSEISINDHIASNSVKYVFIK